MSEMPSSDRAPAAPAPSLARALAAIAQNPQDPAGRVVVAAVSGPVRRLARRITGDEALAEDVVQETLLALWERASSFIPRAEPDRDVLHWVLALAGHRALSARRDLHREHARRRRGASSGPNAGPVDTLVREDRAALVRAALAEIEEPWRSALTLRYLAELGYEDIGSRLRMPAATVRSLVHRGLQRLRRRLPHAPDLLSLLPVMSSRPAPSAPAAPAAGHTGLAIGVPLVCMVVCLCATMPLASRLPIPPRSLAALPVAATAAPPMPAVPAPWPAAPPLPSPVPDEIGCIQGGRSPSADDNQLAVRLQLPQLERSDVIGYRVRIDTADADGHALAVAPCWSGTTRAVPAADTVEPFRMMALDRPGAWPVVVRVPAPPLGSQVLHLRGMVAQDHALGPPALLDCAPVSAYANRWYAVPGMPGCGFYLTFDRQWPGDVLIRMTPALDPVLGRPSAFTADGTPIPGDAYRMERVPHTVILPCGLHDRLVLAVYDRVQTTTAPLTLSLPLTGAPVPDTGTLAVALATQDFGWPSSGFEDPPAPGMVDAIPLTLGDAAAGDVPAPPDLLVLHAIAFRAFRAIRLDLPLQPRLEGWQVLLALPPTPPPGVLVCGPLRIDRAITDAGEVLHSADPTGRGCAWATLQAFAIHPPRAMCLSTRMTLPTRPTQVLTTITGAVALTVQTGPARKVQVPLDRQGRWLSIAGHPTWALRISAPGLAHLSGNLVGFLKGWAHGRPILQVDATSPLAERLSHVELVDPDGKRIPMLEATTASEGHNDIENTSWIFCCAHIPVGSSMTALVAERTSTRMVPVTADGPLPLDATHLAEMSPPPTPDTAPSVCAPFPLPLQAHIDPTTPFAAALPVTPTPSATDPTTLPPMPKPRDSGF